MRGGVRRWNALSERQWQASSVKSLHSLPCWPASPTVFNPSSRRLPLCQTSIRGPRDLEPSRRRDLLQERFEALEDSLAALAFGADADEERLRAIETSQTSAHSGVEVKDAGDSD